MGKINPKNFGAGFAFAILLFLVSLEDLTKIGLPKILLKHIDEILVLGCMIYLVLHVRFLFKKKRVLLYLWIAFLGIGAVSSVVNRYQSFIPSIMDAAVVINKFMVAYLTAYVFASLHKSAYSNRLVGTARLIACFVFLLAVHDMFFSPFFPLGEYRYFTHSLVLMFPHATYLAAAMATLLILLGYTNRKTENIPFMLMVSFVGIMTLRGKAIAFFLVYWALYICITIFKNRHYIAMMVGGGIGCVIIAFEQISDYLLTTTRFSPRQIMLKDSVHLALDHFPFGTGLGTYGSTIAAQYYSPIYTQLGYPELRGMSPSDPSFLTDSFWPEIIAQFGFFGTILFVAVLCYLLVCCLRKLKCNIAAGFAMLAIMINMLINSMAESSFFNPASFLLFIIFGLCEAEKPTVNKQNTEQRKELPR